MKITDIFTADKIMELLQMPRVHNGHHIVGSSSMGRTSLCSGSVLMSLANMDIDTSNEASDAGTKNHKAIEDTIVDALSSGKPPTGDHHTEAAYKAVCVVIDSLKEAGWTIKSYDSEITLLPKVGEGQGTIDLLIIAEKAGKGLLFFPIDFKTGQIAEANTALLWQLRDHIRLCFDAGADIVYANGFSTERSEWLYDEPIKARKAQGDHDFIGGMIDGIINMAFDPHKATCTPSDEACKYCRGALANKCPAYLKQNRDASTALVVPAVDDLSVFSAIALIKNGEVTPELKAKVDAGKALHKKAQAYLDGIKEELDGAVKAVGGTDGYMVQTVKDSESVDYKACWMAVKQKVGNTTAEIVFDEIDQIEHDNKKFKAGYTKVAPRSKKVQQEQAGILNPTPTVNVPLDKGATETKQEMTPPAIKGTEAQTTEVSSPTSASVVAPNPSFEQAPDAGGLLKKPRKQRADKGQKRGARYPINVETLDVGPMGMLQAFIICEIDDFLSAKMNDVAKVNYYAEYRAKIGKELSQMTCDELRAMSLEASKL